MIFIAWDQEKSANVTAGKRSFADDLFSIIDETWLEQSQIEFGRDEFVEVDDGSIALPEDSMPVPWGKGAPPAKLRTLLWRKTGDSSQCGAFINDRTRFSVMPLPGDCMNLSL
jgi:hypothetical protein